MLSWAWRGAVTVARPGSARLGAGGDSDEEGAVGWRRGTVGSEKRSIARRKSLATNLAADRLIS